MITQYRHLAIDNAAGTWDPQELAAIQSTLGVQLPPDVLEFLRAAHGGSLQYYQLDVPAGDDESDDESETEPISFSTVFLAGKDERGTYGSGTILGEIEQHREARRIAREVLPFASDAGGSTAYLDLSAQGKGRVLVYATALPEWTGSKAAGGMVEVAASFPEFIDKLYVDEELVREDLEEAVEAEDDEAVAQWKCWLAIAVPDWEKRFGDLVQ